MSKSIPKEELQTHFGESKIDKDESEYIDEKVDGSEGFDTYAPQAEVDLEMTQEGHPQNILDQTEENVSKSRRESKQSSMHSMYDKTPIGDSKLSDVEQEEGELQANQIQPLIQDINELQSALLREKYQQYREEISKLSEGFNETLTPAQITLN